eukprot:3954433-Prymnesium_polylepis.1
MIEEQSCGRFPLTRPQRAVMLARVAAIKAALGLSPSVAGAIPIKHHDIGAANLALGIEPAESAKSSQ